MWNKTEFHGKLFSEGKKYSEHKEERTQNHEFYCCALSVIKKKQSWKDTETQEDESCII